MLSVQENELLVRTGPGTEMGTYLRRYWVPVCLSSEVAEAGGAPVRLRILGEDLVAFRDSEGEPAVVQRYCPHRRADLFFGRNEDGGLRCVFHGWKFARDGRCLEIPSEPKGSTLPAKISLVAYPAREFGGLIWAYLGPQNDMLPELPQLEWACLPAGHRVLTKRWQECNWLQAVEGGIDSSHISFLHRAMDPNVLSEYVRERLPRVHVVGDTAPKFNVKRTPYGAAIGAERQVVDGGKYIRVTQCLLPFYTMIPGTLEDDSDLMGHAWVPIDDENCWVFSVTWRCDRAFTDGERKEVLETSEALHPQVDAMYRPLANRDNDYLIDRELQRTGNFTGIRGVSVQDAAIQESQGRIVDRSQEHLGTSDTAVIAYRRILLRELRAQAAGEAIKLPFDGKAYAVRSGAMILDDSVDPDPTTLPGLTSRAVATR